MSLSTHDCTLSTCPLSDAQVQYIPSLAGNALYLSIFALLLAVQMPLGLFYRTWGFGIAMVFGLVLEIIGYTARLQLHQNPFSHDAFLIYLITLTIAPVFIAAAIYLSLSRLPAIYGPNTSPLPPRVYTILFICLDFLSLLLQAGGGALTAIADDSGTAHMGIHIMIGGLALQVAGLVLFCAVCGVFAWRVDRVAAIEATAANAVLRRSGRFKGFLGGLCPPSPHLRYPILATVRANIASSFPALALATACILIRSIFRVAELSEGFNGPLANQQVTFMVLEGAMVVLAAASLTVFHPAFAMRGAWKGADFKLCCCGGRAKRRPNQADLHCGVAMQAQGAML